MKSTTLFAALGASETYPQFGPYLQSRSMIVDLSGRMAEFIDIWDFLPEVDVLERKPE